MHRNKEEEINLLLDCPSKQNNIFATRGLTGKIFSFRHFAVVVQRSYLPFNRRNY